MGAPATLLTDNATAQTEWAEAALAEKEASRKRAAFAASTSAGHCARSSSAPCSISRSECSRT